ncbi:MAG: hypothetical protein ACKO0Z_21210 [Betaproteobacteria bacterium]
MIASFELQVGQERRTVSEARLRTAQASVFHSNDIGDEDRRLVDAVMSSFICGRTPCASVLPNELDSMRGGDGRNL